MQSVKSPTAVDVKRAAMPAGMAAMASGRLGARIVRLAQVAAAVHAAEKVKREAGR
jgi:hypothetical protein